MRIDRLLLNALALTLLLGSALAAPTTREARAQATDHPGGAVAQWSPEAVTGPVEAVVEIEGPGLWDLYRTNRENTDGILMSSTLHALDEALMRRQAQVAVHVEEAGATVIGHYTAALNGLHVRATREQLEAIAGLPGIARVREAPIVSLDLADAMPHVGAVRARQELGLDGTGAVVAIIDSGVDYTHASLGGLGTAAAHQANDENVVEPGTFPTNRVIGGWDFAGQRYTPGCTGGVGVVCTSQPRPDGDPLDPAATDTGPAGHGTHVSSIVAGQQVGDPAAGGIAAGVAPGASLVALKVFGNPVGIQATTGLSALGIDWVVRHNLAVAAGDPTMDVNGAPPQPVHVINLSLGSDWGPTLSVFNDVVDRVIESGATVVASAGNDGSRPYITGSPAASEHALSVANSYSPGEQSMYMSGTWLEGSTVKTRSETARQGAVRGEVESGWLPALPEGGVSGQLAYYGLGCSNPEDNTPSAPEQDVNGKIALLERGVCPFYDKVWNAQKLGAIAALVFNDPRYMTTMGCGAPSDCENGPSIPAVMIERPGGLAFRDLVMDGTREITVTLDVALQVPLTDTHSPDSSRGPARASGQIKPQISAPGMRVHAARSGSGNEGVTYDGTSMSGPVVTGVAALLWQRNLRDGLELEPLDISALAMNYADPVIYGTPEDIGGDRAPIARQGAGLVDAFGSGSAMTVVRSEEGIAELSFGELHPTETATRVVRQLTVRNLSATAKTYRLGTLFNRPAEDDNGGIVLSFDSPTITVDGRGTRDLDVTLTADATRVRQPWALRGTDAIRDEILMALHEVDGWVTLTEVDGSGRAVENGDRPAVPFHVLPRATSCVLSDPGVIGTASLDGPSDGLALGLVNACPVVGTVETYALLGTDPSEEELPGELDIRAVGAALIDDPDYGKVLEFAIRMRGDRRMPNDTDVRVYLDLDRDGRWDKVIFAIDALLINENDASGWGRWLVLHSNALSNLEIASAGLSPYGLYEEFDIADTVWRLAVSTDDPDIGLGLDALDPGLTFDVAVRVQDQMSDYPDGPGGAPLRDDAPSGFAASGGPRYTFSRQANNCLAIRQPDGRTGQPGRGSSFTVPADSSSPIVVSGCASAYGPTRTGVLFSYPSNAPGGPAAETVEVLVRTNRPTILLPYVARRHELVVRPTEVPTEVPTELPPTTPPTVPPTVVPPSPSTVAPTPMPTTPTPPKPTDVPLASRFVITYLQCSGPDEYVRVENLGQGSGDLAGWTLRSVVGDERFTFPTYNLAPGDSVTIHSGPFAPPTGGSLFRWTLDYVWNADGDEAQLIDPSGRLVDRDGC